VQAHLNFASWAPRALLETIASGLVKAATPMTVANVYDQYLSFVALEGSLFTLGLEDSYVQLNDNQASEQQLAEALSSVVEGLFSVCVTLALVPRIRCAPGGLAEHVSRALSAKIVDHLRGKGATLFSGGQAIPGSSARRLLCIFDRNFDLVPMVEQPFTYKALVHDCLGMQLNKVDIVQTASAGAPGKPVSIEITDDDVFWQQHGQQEFGAVAAEMDVQVWTRVTFF
jgi:sec1 family domain-containing protein 1